MSSTDKQTTINTAITTETHMESAIWGLLGTIVGALASIGTTWLNNRSTSQLQRDRTNDERIERSNALQRETLLALQDAIHDFIRLIHRVYLEDMEAYRSTKTWGKNFLAENLDEETRLAQRQGVSRILCKRGLS